MEYLLVTTSPKLIQSLEDSYFHIRGSIDCGVIIETNSGNSETNELFKKIKEMSNEPFTIVRLSRIQQLGHLESILDICSTAWVK